jgi:hypothetical protein
VAVVVVGIHRHHGSQCPSSWSLFVSLLPMITQETYLLIITQHTTTKDNITWPKRHCHGPFFGLPCHPVVTLALPSPLLSVITVIKQKLLVKKTNVTNSKNDLRIVQSTAIKNSKEVICAFRSFTGIVQLSFAPIDLFAAEISIYAPNTH